MKPNNLIRLGVDTREAIFATEYVKDFSVTRAAVFSGLDADDGHALFISESVQQLIMQLLLLEPKIDKGYILDRLVDTVKIANYQGNLGAANVALKHLAQHVDVDSLVSTKMDVSLHEDGDMVARLQAGRARVAAVNEVSFL